MTRSLVFWEKMAVILNIIFFPSKLWKRLLSVSNVGPQFTLNTLFGLYDTVRPAYCGCLLPIHVLMSFHCIRFSRFAPPKSNFESLKFVAPKLPVKAKQQNNCFKWKSFILFVRQAELLNIISTAMEKKNTLY